MSSELLAQVLPGSTLVVAIDPGKVAHRVWFSTGDAGLLEEPRSVPSLRPGLDDVEATIRRLVGAAAPIVAIESTGALHGPWVRALEQRFPSSVRVFAPSETAAARAQLGSRRFKSDDRDCAALTYLARQGQGRRVVDDPVEAMRASVRYRRGLVAERKVAQQAVARSAQRVVSGPVSTRGPRPCLGAGGQLRAGGTRLRGRLRWPSSHGPLAAGPRAGTVVRQ